MMDARANRLRIRPRLAAPFAGCCRSSIGRRTTGTLCSVALLIGFLSMECWTQFTAPQHKDAPSLPVKLAASELSGASRSRDFSRTLPRDDLMLQVEHALVSDGYSRAAKLAAKLSDSEDRLQCWMPIISAWARKDPAAASQFALQLPAGLERQAVLATAISSWSVRDVTAAAAWLNALEPHADYDGAIAAVAHQPFFIQTWPDVALSLADGIKGTDARWETMRAIVQDWALRDEFAAKRYVEKSPDFSADQRALLLTRVSQHTRLLD